jgi:NitT/TauT family transport system substrate-binding protein
MSKYYKYVVVVVVVVVVSSFVILNYLNRSPSGNEMIEVNLQLNWFPDGEHSYFYLAKNKKLFREAGFDVTLSGGKGSELSSKLLAGNSVDFALTGADALLGVVEQGGDLKSLGIVYNKTPVVIYSLSKKNIKSLSDLEGKRLGVLIGSNTYIQYKGLLKKENLIDIGVIEVPVDGRAAPVLLNEGDIDALMYYDQYVDTFEKKFGLDYNKIKFSDYLNIYGMVLATNEKTIKRLGKENIDKFVNVVRESIALAYNNPEDAINALSLYVPNIDKGLELVKLKSILKIVCNDSIGSCGNSLTQTNDGWVATSETALELGVINNRDVWENVIIKGY